jgi:Ca2+-binding RTX toxin-like protein
MGTLTKHRSVKQRDMLYAGESALDQATATSRSQSNPSELSRLVAPGPIAFAGDDYAGDITTTGTIAPGGSVSGVFEVAGDVDWFAITLSAGQTLRIAGPASLGAILFYNAAGAPLALDSFRVFDAAMTTQSATFTAATAGTYFVGVSGASAGAAYTLSAQLTTPGANPNNVAPIPPPTPGYSTYLGGIDADGVNWFSVALAAGQSVQLDVQGASTNVYSPYGAQAPVHQYLTGLAGQGQVTTFTAQQAGTYFVTIAGHPGNGFNLAAIVATDDYADGFGAYGSNIEPFGALSIGGSASGTSEFPNDVDWFAITLAAGQAVKITGTGTGSLFYDSSGNPVKVDFFRVIDNVAGTIAAGFTAVTGGTYYVSASAYGLGAQYTLSAELMLGVHPNDVSTFPILLDGGVYDANAAAWYAVTLAAGQTVLLTAGMEIFDVFGNSAALPEISSRPPDYGANLFTASQAGTYYFIVYPSASGSQFAVDLYTDDYADSANGGSGETVGTLNAAGQTVTGVIEIYDDRDAFAINLTAGQTVKIDLTLNSPHLSPVPFTVVERGTANGFHAQIDDPAGGTLVFTAPTTGIYDLVVDTVSYYRGTYTVSIATVAPSAAYDGLPTIIPALPLGPPTPNTTAQVFMLGGAQTIAAGTAIFAEDLIPPSNGTFEYFHIGGPLVVASNFPTFTTVLNNAGVVWNRSSPAPFTSNLHYSSTAVFADSINNSGTIIAELDVPYMGQAMTFYGSATALFTAGIITGPHNVTNTGLISARASEGNAIGFRTTSASMTITNSGVIAAKASAVHDLSQSGGAVAITASNDILVINQTGGVILAEGDGLAHAISIGRGGHPAATDALQVLNYGLIEAHGIGIGAVSYAIYVSHDAIEAGGGIENFGIIRADDFAIYAPSEGTFNLTSPTKNPQSVINHAGALIEGDIELFRGNDVIQNQGTITGHIDMGEDNDLFDNTGGLVNGVVDLSYDDDQFIGGNNADFVRGGTGNDTLSGTGGGDLLLGGNGGDTIAGGAGNDGLYGEQGNDQITTAGGDFVSGGTQDDRIIAGDYAFASIAGGAGFDTWLLPTGSRILDLALVVASGRVTGFEHVEMVGGQTLVIRPADVGTLSGATALFISGTNTDAVYLAGGWAAGGQFVRDGVTYTTYSSGAMLVHIAAGVAATTGAAPPAGTGLDAVAAGAAAPVPGTVPGADLAGPEVNALGLTIMDELVITAGEIWQNLGGYGVVGGNGIEPALINHGTILSTGANIPEILGPIGSAYAVGFNAYDHTQNFGSIIASAVGAGNAIAYEGAGFNTFVNEATGAVRAFADAGFAVAMNSFEASIAPQEGLDAAIVNRGDIFAFSNTGFATAITGGNPKFILNEGVIEADGGDGAIAVDLFSFGGKVVNHGQIIAFAPATSTFLSVGISFFAQASVENTGLIAAEIAIDVFTRYGYKFEVINSGTIIGDIVQTHYSGDPYGGVAITNSGEIFGAISLNDNASAIQIINTNRIEGNISLGAANDQYSGGGVLVGSISGGEGADVLIGGLSADTFFGDAGADVLDGAAGGDVLRGGAGNDTLLGGDGGDVLAGGLGADNVQGGAGNDTLSWAWGDGGDALDGGGDVDTLNASGNGLDNLLRAHWTGSALASAFDATLIDIEAIHVDMGAGVDTLLYINTLAAVSVNLAAASASGFAALAGVENVFGGAGGDALSGDGGVNQLQGLGGDDTLQGGGNNDILLGGDGADALNGGTGNDSVQGGAGDDSFVWAWGDGVDSFNGGAGFDVMTGTGSSADNIVRAVWTGAVLSGTLNCALSGVESVSVDMGAGTDTLIYTAAGAVSVDLAAGTATGFAAIAGIEVAIGGGGGDVLSGDAGANQLLGLGGDDALNGAAGADILLGGDGADALNGGTGNDSMAGGAGNDTFVWVWGDGVDSFNGGADFDTVNAAGSAAGDIVRAVWTGSALSGAFNCALIGIEAVSLSLGAGVDWLVYTASAAVTVNLSTGAASGFAAIASVENAAGGGGGDLLIGDSGANRLDGGDGADTLNGGLGADFLIGGAGADTFVFASALGAGNVDSVFGFSVVDDTVRLDPAVFAALAAGGLDADAFHAGAVAADAEDRILYNSATGALSYDPDGTGAAAAIQFAVLAPALALTEADFFIGP